MSKEKKQINCKLGTVGGQAVMEGVMMRSKKTTAISVRRMDNKKIVVRTNPTSSIRNKVKFFRLPLIRGIVNFVEMLLLSFSTLTASTEMLGLETEEEPSKFEKWCDKHFGKGLMGFISVISVIFGLLLAVGLFILLPMGTTKLVGTITGGAIDDMGWLKTIIEGVLKVIIFIAYLLLTSLIPDIKRVYMYHGSEHKSIFCYENGLELTVENVKKQSRFHPRCGTSFMFVMVILSIIVSIVAFSNIWIMWLRTLLKLLALPVIVGIGYEFIMYAGKHNNAFVRIVSTPGLWMQRITTKEPTDDMIEVAIVSVKAALHEEFPEFDIPFEEKVLAEMEAEKAETAETAETEKEKPADDDIRIQK